MIPHVTSRLSYAMKDARGDMIRRVLDAVSKMPDSVPTDGLSSFIGHRDRGDKLSDFLNWFRAIRHENGCRLIVAGKIPYEAIALFANAQFSGFCIIGGASGVCPTTGISTTGIATQFGHFDLALNPSKEAENKAVVFRVTNTEIAPIAFVENLWMILP